MTESNATPEPTRERKRRRIRRATKYPAHLAVMLPAELKTSIISFAAVGGESQGDVVRRWLEIGRSLDGNDDVIDRERVRRLAAEADPPICEADALAVLVEWALREIDRRTKRNAELAANVARDFQAGGISLDGVEVGNVEISVDR
jgi:hypothetical protein